jgi:hypothetical protein
MSQIIDDKVDKLHEALTKMTGRKAAAAIAMVIVLLASLYIRATYKEYDQVGNEQSWSIVRRIVRWPAQGTKHIIRAINGVERVTTLTTSSSGEFSMSFTPTPIGLYTIMASPGNER